MPTRLPSSITRSRIVSSGLVPRIAATSASVRSLDKLAERTSSDADKLAEAITILEAGSELSDEQASLLVDVVGKLRKQPDQVPASILAKQLELQKYAV